MAIENKKGVRHTHDDYGKYSAKWRRCRDVMSGQDAIHGGGELYLPKLKEQEPEDYKSYVLRAPFYNASWRTVAGLAGMMFRKPPKQVLPKNVVELLKNVNMKGVQFDQFAQDVATDVLEVGRIGLLVDHPSALVTDKPVTLAVAEANGMRPTIQSYPAESIINWKFRLVNNYWMLSLVVLKEDAKIAVSEFEDKTETHYRVLDLTPDNVYRVRVFRINDKDQDEQIGKDVFPMMNGKTMPYISFVFIGPDGTEADFEEPPLIDLIDVNLSHYRTTADYEHGCHFTGLPTPWVAGYSASLGVDGKAEKLYIGSQSAWLFADPNAKAGYLEFTGKGLDELRKNLDAKKQEMATLGARMLADTSIRQVETFGATAIKHVAENSILAAIAVAVSTGLTTALKWFAEWANSPAKDIVYDINKDFLPVQMDAPTLTALVAAWQQGALSGSELFDTMKRGDLIESDKTLEEHQAEIDSAPPPAPPSTVQPGNLGTLTHAEAAKQAADAAALMPDKTKKAA